jgi:hypothetical protein
MDDLCADCGRLIGLVGIRHRCIGQMATPVTAAPSAPQVAARKPGAYPDTDHRRGYMRMYMAKRRHRHDNSQAIS